MKDKKLEQTNLLRKLTKQKTALEDARVEAYNDHVLVYDRAIERINKEINEVEL